MRVPSAVRTAVVTRPAMASKMAYRKRASSATKAWAASVAAGLERCGPLGPEAALAWSRDGGLRYRWAELPEPFLSTNPASLSEFTPVLEPEPALTLEADLTLEPAPAPNTAGGGEVS